jgi:predicted protein tyrosine phosphatase
MLSTRLTPNGKPLRGSAGALILKDLGLTDEALAAFLPADAPAWLRGVFWCHFTGPSSLEAIHQHFLTQAGGRFAVSQTVGLRFPPDGPEEGVALPSIYHAMRDTSLSPEQIEWADLILVMEKVHRARLKRKFGKHLAGKRVVVLEIPDNYRFMDPELVRLLEARCAPYLRGVA